MAALVCIVAARLLVAAEASAQPARALDLRLRPLSLDEALIERSPLVFAGGFELVSSDPDFGGVSGAAWDGARLLAVTDKGDVLQFAPLRDEREALAALGPATIAPLADATGAPLDGRGGRDAEALARAPGGGFWVAFERAHRIDYYADLAGPQQETAAQLPEDRLDGNGGLEALAIDADGALIALAEEPLRGGSADRIEGWRLIAGRAEPLSIARLDGYGATDAGIGPDGRLYLLERRFSIWSGVRMRLRRFDLPDPGPDGARDLGVGETLLTLDHRAPIDNMEAMALSSTATGGVRFTLLSDDNFSASQRTVLLEFTLAP